MALETDLSVLLRCNEQVWEFTSRFEIELVEHINRGAQKVLKKLAEGPYRKITDPTLRRIWEEEVERKDPYLALHMLNKWCRNGPTP